MPWKETTTMSERTEFIKRIQEEDISISALCREYGISRPTGYKWLKRYAVAGMEGLQDQSRRPHRSPSRTLPEIETAIIQVRKQHPSCVVHLGTIRIPYGREFQPDGSCPNNNHGFW